LSAALLLPLQLLRACLRAAATATAAIAVDVIALRRPLGSVSAGVCALDLFGRLVVAQKEEFGRGDANTGQNFMILVVYSLMIGLTYDRASMISYNPCHGKV
jgi:hypothetical protein